MELMPGCWRRGDATATSTQLQRSFDGGATYTTLHINGVPVTPQRNSTEQFYECEEGVLYRLNVLSVTGTLTVRASR